MTGRNICKFVSDGIGAETLETSKFIYEAGEHRLWHEYTPKGDMLLLAVLGAGTFTLGNDTRKISVGDLFFVFAGETCRIESSGDLHYIYIEYTGSRCTALYARSGVTGANRFFGGMESLVPIFKESLHSASGANVDLLSESMLLYAFSKLRSDAVRNVDTLEAVRTYVENHFTEQDLRLGTVANALGYNEKYLSHLMKTQLGAGFSSYLKNLRLRCAILLMQEGVSSVKNVAILSGFSDPLYFSKVFRQEFGMSPREYLEKSAADPTEKR